MRQKHHGRAQSNETDSHLRSDGLFVSPAGQQEDPMAQSILLVRMYFLLAVVAAFVGTTPTAARAQAGFDGLWTILIVTEAGECDRAYRYGVQIDHGRIVYDGTAGVELTGTVDQSGRVSATVQRGEQGATGTGRLSGGRGRGTWRGRSSASQCSGYWEAERR